MVKKVFPLLLSYVFVTTQCWAISGGPNYGSGSSLNTVGSYSGSLIGDTESDAATSQPSIPGDKQPSETSANTTASNALGLFDLVVPGVGNASGNFLLFADGTVFGGTIEASVDPDSGVLRGVVQGTFNFNLTTIGTTGTTATTAVTATAAGGINAKVSAAHGSNSTERLNGTADLEVNFGQYDTSTLEPIVERVITFTVIGFQQSTTAATSAATIGTGTTGSSASTGG